MLEPIKKNLTNFLVIIGSNQFKEDKATEHSLEEIVRIIQSGEYRNVSYAEDFAWMKQMHNRYLDPFNESKMHAIKMGYPLVYYNYCKTFIGDSHEYSEVVPGLIDITGLETNYIQLQKEQMLECNNALFAYEYRLISGKTYIVTIFYIGNSKNAEHRMAKWQKIKEYVYNKFRAKLLDHTDNFAKPLFLYHDPKIAVKKDLTVFPLEVLENRTGPEMKLVVESRIGYIQYDITIKRIDNCIDQLKEKKIQLITDKKSYYNLGFIFASVKQPQAIFPYFCKLCTTSTFCQTIAPEEVFNFCRSNGMGRNLTEFLRICEKAGVTPSTLVLT